MLKTVYTFIFVLSLTFPLLVNSATSNALQFLNNMPVNKTPVNKMAANEKTGIQGFLPLINGGKTVSADDPIAKSTVMLETEAQYCSASIISEGLLITAAHCIGEREPWVMIHFAGLDGKISRKAERAFRHEAYQDLNETTRNDIALVFFNEGLPEGFAPVPLLPVSADLKINDDLVVAGYGGGGPLGTLAKLNLQISEFPKATNLIKLTQTNKLGICHGDSGGPAFYKLNNKLYLAGVASYTNEMDCSGFSVYTRTSDYLDWIASKQKTF